MMENDVVLSIAEKHGKTPAQVLLRFIVQKGIVVIPKSTNPQRLALNIEVHIFLIKYIVFLIIIYSNYDIFIILIFTFIIKQIVLIIINNIIYTNRCN
jgi:hypothetical protein